METQLDNPVIKDTSELENKFLEAARLADAGQDIPADLIQGEKSDPPSGTVEKEKEPAGTNPDNSETDPEKAKERPRDALGRFTKTEDGTDIPEAERKPAEALVEAKKPEQTPTPSEFEKAKQARKQKEQERQDRSWEAINRTKDEIAQAKAEIEQQRRQLEQRATTPPVPQLPRDEDGEPITSKALMRAHRDFKERAKSALAAGDYDAFNENTGLAEASMENARQVFNIEEKVKQETAIQAHRSVWNAHLSKIVEKDPDVFKLDTPIGKEMQSLMQQHGQVFGMFENGAAIAYDIAKLRIEAGSASELRDANKKLQAEIDRLNGLTAISGSGPTSQPTKKKFEELSTEEQTERVMAAARAHDEGRN